MRKPRGSHSVLTFDSDSGTFHNQVLPEAKEDIECEIVEAWWKQDWETHLIEKSNYVPTKNRENDFDFKLVSSNDVIHLELAEIAPLKDVHGKYDCLPLKYWVKDYAQFALSLVEKKAQRYGYPKDISLWLLLFATDDRLMPVEKVADLFSYQLCGIDQPFECVALFGYRSEMPCTYLCYPETRFLKAEEKIKEATKSEILLADLSNATWEDGAFIVDLPRPGDPYIKFN